MEGVTSPPLDQGSTRNSYFNPLLISMLGIVVTAFAIIAYHFVLVKYCIRRHASSTTAAQSPTASKPPTGVDDNVLKSIPIVAFSAVKGGIDQLDIECVVCLGDMEDEDMVRLLPNCKHAFHAACIDQWFVAHESCPTCRSPIEEQIDAAGSVDPQYPADDSDRGGIVESNSGGEQRSSGLLRHCVSLVLPLAMEERSCSRLKRSVSVGGPFVVINLQMNNFLSDSSSSRGILTSSGSRSAPPLTHFDPASAKWLRSLPRLQMGTGRNAAILPF